MTDKAAEEKYCFYLLANMDLERSLNILKIIRRYRKTDVINSLIRDAIINYVKPFINCNGQYGTYRLKERFIPPGHKALHKELLDYRKKIFAHTDITVRNPNLGRLRMKSRDIIGMSFNPFPPSYFKNKLPKIEQLIIQVRESLLMERQKIEEKLY